MSIELYKAEAARLAEYLFQRHNIKIPRPSTLECIARVHGCRDWNELVAQDKVRSRNADIAPVEPSSDVAGLPGISLAAELARLCAEGFSDLYFVGNRDGQLELSGKRCGARARASILSHASARDALDSIFEATRFATPTDGGEASKVEYGTALFRHEGISLTLYVERIAFDHESADAPKHSGAVIRISRTVEASPMPDGWLHPSDGLDWLDSRVRDEWLHLISSAEKGLFAVCSPTGHGKSTTVRATAAILAGRGVNVAHCSEFNVTAPGIPQVRLSSFTTFEALVAYLRDARIDVLMSSDTTRANADWLFRLVDESGFKVVLDSYTRSVRQDELLSTLHKMADGGRAGLVDRTLKACLLQHRFLGFAPGTGERLAEVILFEQGNARRPAGSIAHSAVTRAMQGRLDFNEVAHLLGLPRTAGLPELVRLAKNPRLDAMSVDAVAYRFG